MKAWWLHPLTLQVVAACAYAAGGACMKASEGLTRLWPSLGLFAAFLLGMVLQTLSMRTTTMGSAYIIVLGLEALAALAISLAWFHESFRPVEALAVVLIVVGVGLLKA